MKVLIINDDSISLKFQQLLVERSNIARSIITTLNGREALDYIASMNDSKSYPNLILLDIHMPIMNGWQFLDEFTKLHLPDCPETKVVITSFTIDPRELTKASDYPCVINFQNSGLTAEFLKELKF
jgi:CheY-like chemotaxis protein